MTQPRGLSGAVRIGVLGDANAGKSTLVNALVIGDHPLLPSAGVGPVTGRAVCARFSASPELVVRFAAPRFGFELCYALEHLDAATGGVAVPERDYMSILPVADRRLLQQAAQAQAHRVAHDATAGCPHIANIASKARLLAFGGSYGGAAMPAVRHRLRHLLGIAHVAPDEADARIAPIIRQWLACAGSGQALVLTFHGPALSKQLAAFVTGALSVITEDVELGWPSSLLAEGLTLVDLPGVGIAGDAHQEVTHSWLRQPIDALLLVCNRAGISSAVESALIETGALSRLIQQYRPSHPNVVVAVTKLDDEAAQLRRTHRRLPALGYFTGLAANVVPLVRSQLAASAQRATGGDGGALARNLPVVAVAGPPFLDFGDSSDRKSFFEAPEQTNIPRLAQLLANIARHGHATKSNQPLSEGAAAARLEQEHP